MCANLLLFFELALISQPKSRGHREPVLKNRVFRVQTPTFAGRRLLRLRQRTMVFNRSAFMHSRYSVPKNYIFAQKIRASGKSKASSDKLKGEIPAQNGEEWKKVGRRCNKLGVCCNAFLLFFEPLPYFFATSSRKNEQKNGDFRTQIPPHRIYTHKKAQILTIIASICAFILPVSPSAKFENRFTPRMKGSFERRDGNGGNIYANIGKKIAEIIVRERDGWPCCPP